MGLQFSRQTRGSTAARLARSLGASQPIEKSIMMTNLERRRPAFVVLQKPPVAGEYSAAIEIQVDRLITSERTTRSPARLPRQAERWSSTSSSGSGATPRAIVATR